MSGQLTYGLGQGQVNSWTDSLTDTEVPCLAETTGASTAWIVFLIAGIIIGSLQFEKGKAGE